jgi:hypothetical protein
LDQENTVRRFGSRTDAVVAFALALASFLLYLRTLAPDVVDADGGEFQLAAWNFGFVHPTGYPLYLIFGGLFQHLVPLGNPAYRLNLFTALTAACAVAALYLAAHGITRHRGAAILAAFSFAVTRAFWYDASAAEAYDLNAFFVALLIFIALRWQAAPSAKKLAVFCFAYALALTHHRSIVLWIPAFALFAYGVWRMANPSEMSARFGWCKPRYFLLFIFSFLLPLTLYLHLPLRAPTAPYFVLPLAPGRDLVLYDNSLTGFVNYILGRTFQSELGWDAVSGARLSAFPRWLFDQFGAAGIALGLIGCIAMVWRKEWAQFALLVTGFVATILFASLYHIADILHYYIPAYLAWAIWIGYGTTWLVSLVQNSKFKIQNARFEFVGLTLLAIMLIIPQVIINFPFADRSRETQARAQWTRILSASIPQNAILISNDRDEMMPLWYIQYVENTRRDLLGLFPLITPAPEYANIGRLTDSVLDANRPVYFIKPMPGIEIKYRVVASDSLWRVVETYTSRVPQHSSGAVLANRVRVLGYDVAREGNVLRAAIYWSPLVKLDRNYMASIQLFGARGGKVAQGNDHQVGGEFYPTTLWEVGETLRDEHTIELPADLAPSTYHLFVTMYRLPDFESLGDPVEIGWMDLR